jgi:hypothetical protein
MAAVNRAIPVFQTLCMRSLAADCTQLQVGDETIAGAHGHAAASAAGIARLAGLSSDFRLRTSMRDSVPTLTVDVAVPDTPACEFTYVEAPHAGASPGIDPASVSCP